MSNSRDIIISTRTIASVVFFALLGYVLYSVFSLVVLLFISLILALGLEPVVGFLRRKRVPRGVAVLLVFLCSFFVIFGIIAFALVPIITQTQSFISKFPYFFEKAVSYPGLDRWVEKLSTAFVNEVGSGSKHVINVTVGAFSGIVSILTILVFTSYILMDFRNLRNLFLSLVPKDERGRMKKLILKIERALGDWIRGQLVLMVVVGVMTFIGLKVVNLDYALSLALIAGLFEVIPIFGPILSLIPAAVVGFAISPAKGMLVVLLYILIQQLEGNLFVPKIMQKATGFNPLFTLIAILVGGKLFGFAGVLFSIPIALVFQTILEFLNE